jgi:hypothetical protein
MKWTYIATAPDQPTAEVWLRQLLSEGIPATLETGDAISAMPCRLLVPQGMVCEAKVVLAQHKE